MAKLALGTVQFGVAYGVSNTQGQVCLQEARKIVDLSLQQNIDVFDTATLYGKSERVLGKVLPPKEGRIITKTPHLDPGVTAKRIIDQLNNSFQESLQKLCRDSIYGLLIHRVEDLLSSNGSALWRGLESLKESGRVKKIGVSVYTPESLDAVLNSYEIDLVQLSLNIFDQRMIHSGLLKKAKSRGIEVHTRSSYLQGLLLMQAQEIPPYFKAYLPLLSRFHEKTRHYGMSNQQAALGFVMNQGDVDYVVVGACNVHQLQESLTASRIILNAADWYDMAFGDPGLIDPSLWRVAA